MKIVGVFWKSFRIIIRIQKPEHVFLFKTTTKHRPVQNSDLPFTYTWRKELFVFFHITNIKKYLKSKYYAILILGTGYSVKELVYSRQLEYEYKRKFHTHTLFKVKYHVYVPRAPIEKKQPWLTILIIIFVCSTLWTTNISSFQHPL